MMARLSVNKRVLLVAVSLPVLLVMALLAFKWRELRLGWRETRVELHMRKLRSDPGCLSELLDHPPESLEMQAVHRAAQESPETVVPLLVDVLADRSRSSDCVLSAKTVIESLGQEAIPELTAATLSEDVERSVHGSLVLRNILSNGCPDDSVLSAASVTLARGLREDNGARVSVVLSKMGRGSRDAVPFLKQALEQGGLVAVGAAYALSNIEGNVDDSVGVLVGYLSSANEQARSWASLFLWLMGKAAIPALEKLVEEKDPLEDAARKALQEIRGISLK